MAGWQVFTATLVMLTIMAVTVASLHQPHRDPDRLSVDRIRERISNEHTASADPILSTSAWSHGAPDHQLDVQEAHRTMQQHRRCVVGECDRKGAAFRALVDAGRIKPTRMPPALQ
ncbi:hypothetical protein OHB26_08925 [Nocardia sp. NBC_01503]|uniref:hypothetical protein n=1 Tax=Nocardia sp. NBC_01503 TaxID=2975997 RepID=UPI002E7BF6AB|nr:hypothetical protein [Nocardia sp. NBC_01503]WTL34304.1 hypothetical protein OHB26_08925 [Nocardia sp. NBC_01503]